MRSFDSSVGRAVDCSGTDIHRSLVRIRLEGLWKFFSFSFFMQNCFFFFFFFFHAELFFSFSFFMQN